jgi:hypothetical protein
MMPLTISASFENLFQASPGFGALGLLAGQDRLPHAVVERVNHHFNRVADSDFQFTLVVQELFAGITPSDLSPVSTVTQSSSMATTVPLITAPRSTSRPFRLSSKRAANDSLM